MRKTVAEEKEIHSNKQTEEKDTSRITHENSQTGKENSCHQSLTLNHVILPVVVGPSTVVHSSVRESVLEITTPLENDGSHSICIMRYHHRPFKLAIIRVSKHVLRHQQFLQSLLAHRNLLDRHFILRRGCSDNSWLWVQVLFITWTRKTNGIHIHLHRITPRIVLRAGTDQWFVLLSPMETATKQKVKQTT